MTRITLRNPGKMTAPVPRYHIRTGLSKTDPTLCQAPPTANDWQNWERLPGSPRLFPYLCAECWRQVSA